MDASPGQAALAVVTCLLCLAGPACGGGGTGGRESTGSPYPLSAPMGVCSAVVQQHSIEGATHVAVCSPVVYQTNPPSSGNHYPIWAAYKEYSSPVPEGFWVHDLEHGAIVITYNCAVGGGSPTACASEVTAAAQMIAGLPSDPECVQLGEGVSRRTVLTPDPKLDVRFAASAWGWTLRANCFDADTFRTFALDHYKGGPEDLCNDGQDPVAQGLASSCGND